jgi:hypothetical protein
VAVLVQHAENITSTGAASMAVGSTQGWAAPTAGDLLVAWSVADCTMTLAGWTAGPSVVDNNAAYMWYKVAAGTESTVTFGAGASASPITVGVLEYSGLQATPFDVQNFSGNQVGGTSATITLTTAATDLVVAVAGTHSASDISAPSWTGGFTNQVLANTGTASSVQVHAIVADLQQTAAGAVSTTASWTGAGNDVQALIMGFKLGGGAVAALPVFATFIGPT